MSAADYPRLNTNELIRHFIGEATRIGGPLSPGRLKVPSGSSEFYRASEALRNISAELMKRKPITDMRERLFNNDSADVRSWAGTLLHEVDPQWAEASVNGLFHGISTREVLAWRHRILDKKLPRAKVRTMSITQLRTYFTDACECCFGATRFLSDEEGGGTTMRVYNDAFDHVRAAAEELQHRDQLRVLLPLLDHQLITVRMHAATYCATLAPERAISALEAIEATKTFPEFAFASTVLDRLRKEKIKREALDSGN